MKTHTKRLIFASLVTPWVVVPVTILFALWHLIAWIGKPLPDPGVVMIWPHPFKPWETVLLYSVYGVPTAYISLLIIGLPCYFIAKKMRLLSLATAVCAARLACIPAAAFYGRDYHFWSTYWFLICFGVPLAVTFGLIIKEKAEPCDPPNH